MPAVTRIDDEDIKHCSTPKRLECSPNVLVNGRKVSRQDDVNTSHKLPGSPCPSHSAPITKGSRTVFINGKGCGRIGDGITGCTSVAEGSSNVFAGG